MFSTLNRRLMISHLGVALITSLALYIFTSQAILRAAVEQSHNRLEDLGFATSNALEEPFGKFREGEASLSSVQATLAHWMSKEDNLHYTIFLPDGTPVIDNLETAPPPADPLLTPEFYNALESNLAEGDVIRINAHGEKYLYVAVRIEHENDIMGVLRLGFPYNVVTAPARRTNQIMLGFMLAILAVVGVGGWLLARSLSEPIRNLTSSSEQISKGNLQARATPTGPQELRRLARAFNRMAERLDEHVSNLQAFVANASHELRTPLTSIKLRVEALHSAVLDDPETALRFVEDIDHETDRLTTMVNKLLDLSQIDAGAGQDTYAPVDLNVLIEEAREIFSVRAQRADLQLTAEPLPGAPAVLGNEEQLRRVLDNLLSNAINNTPAGGKITLKLAPSKTGFLCLIVTDTGRGIEERHLPHIFERFYRVERTRPLDGRSASSGLGLAIVRSIVEAHGGDISVQSQVGEGTTFTIDLPIMPKAEVYRDAE